MYNVLIVGDDPSPFSHLSDQLRKDFFNVYMDPYEVIQDRMDELKHYDFILMHIGKNEEENKGRLIEIKKHCVCPVYIFAEGHDHDEQIRHLEYGSEGYVDIPFEANVVASRIKAVLRYLHQVKRGAPNVIRFGRLVLHMDNRELHIDQNIIPLTKVEFKILHLLIEHRDTVVSKDNIIHYVWDEDSSATDNALGIHITRLRKKIMCQQGQDLIETIWGLGYRINLSVCEKSQK